MYWRPLPTPGSGFSFCENMRNALRQNHAKVSPRICSLHSCTHSTHTHTHCHTHAHTKVPRVSTRTDPHLHTHTQHTAHTRLTTALSAFKPEAMVWRVSCDLCLSELLIGLPTTRTDGNKLSIFPASTVRYSTHRQYTRPAASSATGPAAARNKA